MPSTCKRKPKYVRLVHHRKAFKLTCEAQITAKDFTGQETDDSGQELSKSEAFRGLRNLGRRLPTIWRRFGQAPGKAERQRSLHNLN